MKKLLSLNNIGFKGINSDIKPWELEPEFITEGKNFRIFSGAIKASGGSEFWIPEVYQVVDEFGNDIADELANTISSGTLASSPFSGFIMAVGTTSADYWLSAGRESVKIFDGAIWTDISSSAGYAAVGVEQERDWTGCMLGKIPIINNPQAQPEYWNPQSPGQILQPLPFDAGNTWTAKGYTFQVIRSHKNFLFALNLAEGSNELPDAYRWSTAADINGIPFTWDETDLSGLAGRAQIGGDKGHIVDGLSLRDAFCIYSENGINLLDFTGDEFVWRSRELSATTGLLAKNCVVEVKGKHFFLADGDIVVNDGNTVDSIIHNRLRKRLSSNISAASFSNSFAVRNDALKEVWFCVPEDGSLLPNIAYIYNWKDDSWALRDLPESLSFAAYGSQAQAAETWDTWSGSWDDQARVWGSRNITPLDDTVVGVINDTGSLTILDPEINSTSLDTVVERTDFPLEGHDTITTVSRIYPHIEGSGTLYIQAGSQDYAGASVRWKPEVAFKPETDRKVDVRTTGELHCWRVRSEGSSPFELSGMNFEYSVNGKR